jgi:hypothetical protein
MAGSRFEPWQVVQSSAVGIAFMQRKARPPKARSAGDRQAVQM